MIRTNSQKKRFLKSRLRRRFHLLFAFMGLIPLLLILAACQDKPNGSSTSFSGAVPEGAALRLGKGAVNEVAFSPDGQFIAIAGDVGLYLHEASNLDQIWMIPTITPIIKIAFSPDSQLIATGAVNGTMALVETSSGQIVTSSQSGSQQQSGIQSLAWTEGAGGFLLAAGLNDGQVAILELSGFDEGNDSQETSIALVRQLPRHRSGVTALAFSPNRRFLATGNRGGLINLWDINTGDLVVLLEGHDKGHAVQEIVWSPDGSRIISGARDGRVIEWDILAFSPISNSDPSQGEMINIAYFPDGTSYISASKDGEMVVWNGNSPVNERSSFQFDEPLVSIDWSQEIDKFVTVGESGKVQLWSRKVGSEDYTDTNTMMGHTMPGRWVTDVSWSPDGKRLASILGDEVLIWDDSFMEPILSLTDHASRVTSLAWNPEGDRLATADSGGELFIWKMPDGDLEFKLDIHQDAVTDLSWSPNGDRLSSAGSLENVVYIWDSTDGSLINQVSGPGEGLWSVAWSPDGSRLATGSTFGPIYMWDLDEYQPADPDRTLIRHLNWVSALTWSTDGRFLLSGGADNLVILWDLETGLPTVYPGHTAAVRDVDFNPDGSKFASASRDNLVAIWEVDPDSQRQPLAFFRGHTDGVNALSWSPDGALLASGSDDGTVIFWDMEINSDK